MEELKKKVNESGQTAAEGTAAGNAAAVAAASAENVDQTLQENKIKELTEQVTNSEEEVKKLKKIARHYKTQVDEKTKEMEELKKKVNESGQPTGEGTAAPAATAENVDQAAYETKIKELTEQVTKSEEEVKKLKELDEQNKVSYSNKLKTVWQQ